MSEHHKRVITPENTHDILAEHLLADVFPFVFDLERSDGNYLYDSKANRRYLDAFSFIASNPLGFNHPKMNDPEFERRLLRAAKVKPSNSDLYSVELAEFAEVFYRVALPPEFPHLFFVDGGALAVENALKAAFDWKQRLNRSRGLDGGSQEGSGNGLGTQVIHFREAFHGRSGYTLSLTNTADPRKTDLFPKFHWPRVSNPKCTFPLEGAELEKVIQAERDAEAEIRNACEINGPDIAALIIEPIQGEGGDNHFRREFHASLRRLADEYEFMLIYDEVQSGVGLTGAMWAYQHYGIVPDMVAFGKKMQVCGFMCTDRIDQVERNVFREKSRINSTWGGNLVDMVRAQRFLEIIEEDRLVQQVAEYGETLLRGLGRLTAEFPDLLSNARGKGFMCAIDLPDGQTRDRLITHARESGLIVLPCGTRSLRVRPSLTFTQQNISELLRLLSESAKTLS